MQRDGARKICSLCKSAYVALWAITRIIYIYVEFIGRRDGSRGMLNRALIAIYYRFILRIITNFQHAQM